MAGVWIGIGCALIVGLLFVSVWLPRPGAELVAELPFSVDSPTQESSRYDILGGEAADKDKGGPRSGVSEEDQESAAESEGKKGGAGSESEAEGEGSQAGSRDGEGGSPSQAKSGKKGEGSESKGGERGEQSKSGNRNGKENGRSRSQSEEDTGSRSDETDEQRESRSKSSGGRGRRQSQRRAGQGKKAEQQTAEDDRPTRGAPKRPPLDPRAVIQSAGQWIATPFTWIATPFTWIATLFMWLFYGLLIAVVVYGLWRSRAEVLAALRGFLQGWREFWQRLFGGKPQAAGATALAEQGEKQAGPRPFADFADPFLTGAADRYSADELVSYSFEALEAWARERGWPREPDQTPHEFAQQLGTHVGSLSQDVRRLADLYCRVAYAPGTLPQRSVAPLRDLWHHLHLTPGEQSPAPPLFSPR